MICLTTEQAQQIEEAMNECLFDAKWYAAKEAIRAVRAQEPVAKYSDIVSDGGLDPRNAAPVRTKDLTDDEIRNALYGENTLPGLMNGIRAVIAADREKNK